MNPTPTQESASLRDYQLECSRTNRMLCVAIVVMVVLIALGIHFAFTVLT
jgi:hypothetical protein